MTGWQDTVNKDLKTMCMNWGDAKAKDSDHVRWRTEGTESKQKLQESPANAKGSARQPWYIVRKSPNRPPFRIAQQYQRNLYIVEKYFQ